MPMLLVYEPPALAASSSLVSSATWFGFLPTLQPCVTAVSEVSGGGEYRHHWVENLTSGHLVKMLR